MKLLERLRGGLIVSVQAWEGSAIDDPQVLAAIALACENNGAVGVRMQGVANIKAARRKLSIPIIGLVKRDYEGFQPYITPTLDEVKEVIEAGAQIVAFDSTGRPRPRGTTVHQIVEAIQKAGLLAMADCATVPDAMMAHEMQVDIIATTLCGYTPGTEGWNLPAIGFVAECAKLGTFTIGEGGISRPELVTKVLGAGADAVVVGTAITNIDWLVREFVSHTAKRAW
jgi:N-acylglucosamine-6-phosphate 2-epimerase